MERDQPLSKQQPARSAISTHTLTWSVTLDVLFTKFNTVFQLTRSRGAWRTDKIQQTEHQYFNSHAHVERDQTDQQYNQTYKHFNSHAHVERDRRINSIIKLINISTHTLTWSVTSHFQSNSLLGRQFQLTRSRGAWHDKTTLKGVVGNFNSHAHVERDPLQNSCNVATIHFNSHAHVERDPFL